MGTTELALPQLIEILGPGGEYEKGRLALKANHAQVILGAEKIVAINSAEEEEEATNFGRLLQVASSETEKFFKPYKQQVDAIKAPILKAEHEDADAYEKEKKRIGGLQTVWRQKVRLIQEEEERKAREKALAEAQEAALLRAIEVEAIEGIQAAEQVLQEPIVAAPVITASRAPARPTGSVAKYNYATKLVDLKALVKAILDGKAPLQAIQWNEGWCNGQARAFKDAYSIPGTELVKTEGTHYRG